MAILNINIVNPVIDLISGITNVANSCKTIFSFEVKSIPGSVIEFDLTLGANNPQSYDKIEIDLGNGYETLRASTFQKTLINDTANVKLTIGNSTVKGACNLVRLSVEDTTNNVTEIKNFKRCTVATRC